MALECKQEASSYRTLQTLLKLPTPGLGTAGSRRSERSATTQFTHVNVTLGNLHWFQASILEKVPACHLRGEQGEGDLTTGFVIQTPEGK